MAAISTNETLTTNSTPEVIDQENTHKTQIDTLFEKFNIDVSTLTPEEKKEVIDRFQSNPELYYNNIDNRLAALDNTSKVELARKNTNDKLELLKSWMNDVEKNNPNSSENLVKKTNDAIEKKQKETEEKIKKEAREKFRLTGIDWIDDWTEGLGDYLFDTAKEKATTKKPKIGQRIKFWVAGAIGALFGLKGLSDKIQTNLEDIKNDLSTNFVKNGNTISQSVIANNQNTPDIEKTENNTNQIDTTTEQLPVTTKGSWLALKGLIFLGEDNNLDHSKDNIDYHQPYARFLEDSYKDILSTSYSTEEERKFQEKISTEKFQKIMGYAFYSDIFQSILKPDGQKYNPDLIAKYGKAKVELWWSKSLNGQQLNWKEDFSLAELTDIYANSIPALKYGAYAAGSYLGEKIGFILGESASQARNSIERLFGAGVISIFKSKDNWGGKSLMLESADQGLIAEGSNPEQKEGIKKIVDFKNAIYPSILDNPKLQLSSSEKQAVKEQINYGDILTLYSITGGNTDFSTLHPVSLTLIILNITDILEGKDPALAGSYIGKVSKSSFFNTDLNIFEPREKEILSIIQGRFFNEYMLGSLDKLFIKIGIATGGIGLGAMLGTTLLSAYGSKKLTKAGYKRLLMGKLGGSGLKLTGKGFGILAMFAGIGTVAQARVRMGNIGDDLEKAMNEANATGSPTPIDNYINKVEKSIHSKEYIGRDNKKHEFTSISYPGDSTIFFFDDRVWRLGAIENTPQENIQKDGLEGALNSGKGVLRSVIEGFNDLAGTSIELFSNDENTTPDIASGNDYNYITLNGFRYDAAKVYVENGNVVLPQDAGNKKYEIPIDNIINYFDAAPEKENKDLVDMAIEKGKEQLYGKSGQKKLYHKPFLDAELGRKLGFIELDLSPENILGE